MFTIQRPPLKISHSQSLLFFFFTLQIRSQKIALITQLPLSISYSTDNENDRRIKSQTLPNGVTQKRFIFPPSLLDHSPPSPTPQKTKASQPQQHTATIAQTPQRRHHSTIGRASEMHLPDDCNAFDPGPKWRCMRRLMPRGAHHPLRWFRFLPIFHYLIDYANPPLRHLVPLVPTANPLEEVTATEGRASLTCLHHTTADCQLSRPREKH